MARKHAATLAGEKPRSAIAVWSVTWTQRLKTQPNDIRRAEWERRRDNAEREACGRQGKRGSHWSLGMTEVRNEH